MATMPRRRATPGPSPARMNFVRVANTRTNKALDEIRKIGRIGSASDDRYEYGPVDVRKIIAALQAAVDECERTLNGRGHVDAPRLEIVTE